jgi:uncharacterized protein YidB (DUF937 family)
MGLLDSTTAHIAEALPTADNSQQSGIFDAIIGLINNPQTGGIQGLVNTFEEKGVGGVIASWIGTGENLTISEEQLEAIIGNDRIQTLSQTLGITSQDISGHLSKLLPQVIDRLTPSGTLREDDTFEKTKGLFNKIFK